MLSYRRAWGKIKEIEHNLGVRLVRSEVGGLDGGRTRLTAEGEELLARYRAFRAAAQAHVERDFAEAFVREGRFFGESLCSTEHIIPRERGRS